MVAFGEQRFIRASPNRHFVPLEDTGRAGLETRSHTSKARRSQIECFPLQNTTPRRRMASPLLQARLQASNLCHGHRGQRSIPAFWRRPEPAQGVPGSIPAGRRSSSSPRRMCEDRHHELQLRSRRPRIIQGRQSRAHRFRDTASASKQEDKAAGTKAGPESSTDVLLPGEEITTRQMTDVSERLLLYLLARSSFHCASLIEVVQVVDYIVPEIKDRTDTQSG